MGAPPQILLGNLGMADSLILMVLALVVFGPRRLPQIGRQIGKLMYEFRKASNDFKFQMEEELRLGEDADRRKKEEAERARNLALTSPAQTVESQASIGAVEQASVSAPPPASYSSDDANQAQSPAEAAASPATGPDPESTTEEQHARYPRINPPSTGDPVAAARPNSHAAAASEADVPADASLVAEANIGAEPMPTAPEPSASSDPAASETVSQHG
jgi:sec-independent protein translocase protein TatB